MTETKAAELVTETQAAELVAELLDCEVGELAGQGLFQLGGSSLDASRVSLRLRERLGLQVSVAEVLTTGDLAGLLATGASTNTLAEPNDSPLAEAVPLTWQQRIVWYQCLLDESSTRYHFHAFFDFDRRPDEAVLAEQLRRVLIGAPALRIRLGYRAGEPYQLVPPAEISPQELHIAVAEAAEEVLDDARLLELSGANRRFDLTGEPLLRWAIVVRPSGRTTLVHTEHHLIHDGASFDLILRRLAAGEPGSREDACSRDDAYFRYAAAARPPSDELVRRIAAECAPAAGALLDRRAQPAAADSQLRLPLPPALLAAVRQLAQAEGISTFAVLFTGFAAALARLTGRHRFVLGTAVANRPPELAGVVGMFVSTTPVPVLAAPVRPDLAGLHALADQLTAAILRADVPLPDIVSALAGPAGGVDRGLVSAAFSMHEESGRTSTVAGLPVTVRVGAFNGASKFGVNAILLADRGSAGRPTTLLLEGDREFVDADDLWALWSYFVDWLQQLTGVRPVPVGDPVDVVAAVCRTATAAADSTALDDGHHALSYRQLIELGDRFRSLHRPAEPIVGLLGAASARFFAAAFAIMYGGAAYLPLDAERHPDHLGLMVRRAGCGTLIDLTGSAPPDWAAGLRILGWDELVAGEPTERGPAGLAEHDRRPAYVMFTSGSTGIPKGVEVGRRALSLFCEAAVAKFGIEAGMPVSQIANIGFDASVLELWATLSVGGTVHIAPTSIRLDPHALRDWLIEHRIRFSFLPTPVGELLLELDWPAGTAFETLAVGGATLHPLPHPVPYRVVNVYGPTECTIVSTWHTVPTDSAGPAEEMPPIGLPLPFGYVRIVDPAGVELPPGETGELWIGGGGVGNGYLDDDRLTRSLFVPDPHSEHGELVYRSGDLCRYSAAGLLEYSGRRDRQVKVSGVRVELGEIEAILLRQPGVRRAVVTTAGQRSGRSKLVAHLVPAPGADRTALSRRVRAALPAFLRHLAIEIRDDIPLTDNGKVPLTMASHPTGTATEPSVLAEISQVAAEYLGSAAIGQSWFELGGSSLDAARLVTQAREVYGVELTLRQLLQVDSVADYLARACAAAPAESAPAERVPAESVPAGSVPVGSVPAEFVPARSAESASAEPAGRSAAVAVLWPTLERLPAGEQLEIAELLIAAARAAR